MRGFVRGFVFHPAFVLRSLFYIHNLSDSQYIDFSKTGNLVVDWSILGLRRVITRKADSILYICIRGLTAFMLAVLPVLNFYVPG